MGGKNSITRLAITGNTRLTLESMKQIKKLKKYDIVCVFGIKDAKSKNKVNYVSLDGFCRDNKIFLDKTEDWESFYAYCLEENIDMIITLGDSRIVPKKITNAFKVIGNHGAILPDVQGGASLVWGRMLNSGEWGISIMKIEEKVDSGDILKVKKFTYDKTTTEKEFTDKADFLTVDALIEVLNGDYSVTKNRKWDVRLKKHICAQSAVEILKHCRYKNLCVYLPPRTPQDGKINNEWTKGFVNVFKIANNDPYPKWHA